MFWRYFKESWSRIASFKLVMFLPVLVLFLLPVMAWTGTYQLIPGSVMFVVVFALVVASDYNKWKEDERQKILDTLNS